MKGCVKGHPAAKHLLLQLMRSKSLFLLLLVSHDKNYLCFRLLQMSKEFPFINDDAEGLRDGNKAFEAKHWSDLHDTDYIHFFGFQRFLALDGSVTRYSSNTPREKLWDLSSIVSFGDKGVSWVK